MTMRCDGSNPDVLLTFFFAIARVIERGHLILPAPSLSGRWKKETYIRMKEPHHYLIERPSQRVSDIQQSVEIDG